MRYEDGGFCYRNPSDEIFREVNDLSDTDQTSIDCLVSIGCGVPNPDNSEDVSAEPKQPLRSSRQKQEVREKRAALDGDSTDALTFNLMYSLHRPYWRLDVKSDIWSLPLETFAMGDGPRDSAKNEKLDSEVRASLGTEDMQQKLDECAHRLVEKRRARAGVSRAASFAQQ